VGAVVIRTAVEGDLETLQVVFRRSSWSNEGDRALLTEHPEFLVLSPSVVREGRTRIAAVDGRIVGFTSVIDRGDEVEVQDLFVDPESMRLGVGRSLVDDVADRARAAGALRVVVDANDHAHEFYARTGFVDVERVTLEHGAATRMMRRL
jgi:GNAT superfamily N-acetyltransferase